MLHCRRVSVLVFLAVASATHHSDLQDETSFLQTYPRPLPQKGALNSCTGAGVGMNLLRSPTADKYFWKNKNGDHICTGSSKNVAPFNISGGPSWTLAAGTDEMFMSNPLIDDQENIYLCPSWTATCYKFNSRGEKLWTFTSSCNDGGGFHMTPAILDGKLYIGQYGCAIAVDMETGNLVWQTKVAPMAAMVLSSTGAYSGVVLVTALSHHGDFDDRTLGDDLIAALNSSSGEVLWTWKSPTRLYNLMFNFVENPSSVISSDSSGSPFRLQLCNGELLWYAKPEPLSVFTTGADIVHEGLGLVFSTSNWGLDQGRLTAYHVGSGERAWQRYFSLPAGAGPAIGNLGGGVPLSVVVALGKPADPFPPGPDGGTYAYRGELRAVDALTGKDTGWSWSPPTWHKQFAEGELGMSMTREVMGYDPCGPDHWTNPAIDGNGTVFAGHLSGHLFAVHDLDGDGKINESTGEVSSWYAGRCFQAPVAISPSMLIGTSCGAMHVF